MASHFSTLPWKIHGWRSLVRLQSMGSLTVRHNLSDFTFTFTFYLHALEKEMATHSSVLAWRIPGTGEPGGLPSMESHRVGHDWRDLATAAAAVAQLNPILCNPMDWSPPGSSVHEIFQGRIMEWVAICFSRGSSKPRDMNLGLLHFRQILYRLSYKGSPSICEGYILKIELCA